MRIKGNVGHQGGGIRIGEQARGREVRKQEGKVGAEQHATAYAPFGGDNRRHIHNHERRGVIVVVLYQGEYDI